MKSKIKFNALHFTEITVVLTINIYCKTKFSTTMNKSLKVLYTFNRGKFYYCPKNNFKEYFSHKINQPRVITILLLTFPKHILFSSDTPQDLNSILLF